MQQQYAAQMDSIVQRLESILPIVNAQSERLPILVATECVNLQFRKILELIAMASLVANREAFRKANRDLKELGKQWNGKAILEIVEEINPDFYPDPLIEEKHKNPEIKKFVAKTKGVLSRGRYMRLYHVCGEILHADNPLGKQTDYHKHLQQVPDWHSRLIQHLACHKIQLVGYDGICLVHLRGGHDGQCRVYNFEKV